ncbi:MAG: thermonuclease family protein [Candidatus Omnitrophota bacterium]
MKSETRWFFLLLPGLCVFSSVLCAEIVTEVGTDGTLTLESGKRVVLAGIQLDTEGISVLRVLVRRQDLRFQLVANSASGKKEFAYAYLKAKCLRFPAKPNEIAGEQEVLVNEFLVKIGAAKVIETQDFSHKARFLKAQKEAKKKGEGIWSYEVS